MKEVKKKLPEFETYVFIDVSNIRSACLKTLGFKIDFARFFDYFDKKYSKLKGVFYYEGIAKGDVNKQDEFIKLEQIGYKVRPLERKAYVSPPVYKQIKCQKCGTLCRVRILKRSTKMKSNVDVYLATDLLKIAYFAKKPTRIILVACDGDYAEMIKSALETNKRVHIDVLATPVVPRVLRKNGAYEDKNTCSTRLQKLRGELPNLTMLNIRNIQDLIKIK